MIALKLVHLIERHSEELAQSLIHKIESSPKSSELKRIPRREIESRAKTRTSLFTELPIRRAPRHCKGSILVAK